MWLDRYVMIPFRDRGRDWSGVDCFGMHLLLCREEGGFALPDHDVSYERNTDAVRACIEREMIAGDWTLIAQGDGAAVKSVARKFDLVVMSAHVRVGSVVRSVELHVGTTVGDGMLIHTERPGGAQVLAMDDPPIRTRIKSVYRHRLQQS